MSHRLPILGRVRALDERAQEQHGLVTRAQALEHLTPRRGQSWLSAGRLVSAARGVYRLAGVPPSWDLHLHAATLAADAVASHRSAARLLGLPVPAQGFEITVPLGRRVRIPDVTIHRSNLLVASLVTSVDGIPCTTPERTLVDLTAVLAEPTCARAVDEAVRRELCSYTSLDGCYRLMRRRGRRRVTVLEEILSRRLDGVEPGDSEWEMRIARWLAEAGFGRPEQGFWVVAGGERFCLDLAYAAARVGIEFDGWDSHRLRGRYDADRRKWRRLELEGWSVLPFTSVCTRREVVDDVGRALRRAPTPRPLVV